VLNGRNKHAATAVDICTTVVHLRRQVIYSDMFLAGSWYSYYSLPNAARYQRSGKLRNADVESSVLSMYCNLNLSFSAKCA